MNCGGPLHDAYNAAPIHLDCLSAHPASGTPFWPFAVAAVVLILIVIALAIRWQR